MVVDRGAGLALYRGEITMLDDAGHWDELVTAGAIKVVVMPTDQLEPGATIVGQEFPGHPLGRELFGSAEDGGKIRGYPALGQRRVQLVQGPSVALALLPHEICQRGSDACFASH